MLCLIGLSESAVWRPLKNRIYALGQETGAIEGIRIVRIYWSICV